VVVAAAAAVEEKVEAERWCRGDGEFTAPQPPMRTKQHPIFITGMQFFKQIIKSGGLFLTLSCIIQKTSSHARRFRPFPLGGGCLDRRRVMARLAFGFR
jgi:hypothetical protein